MAEDEDNSDPGKVLVYLGIMCFWALTVLEFEGSGFLVIPGIILIAIGALLMAQKKGQRFSESFAQQVNPLQPTSKGVEFLETVTGWADNPDTATIPIGAQPEGTHPTMGGISQNEFGGQFSSSQFTRTSTAKDYQRDPASSAYLLDSVNEFADHGHTRIVPLSWSDPVSSWNNVEHEWQNPTDYW